ncbi:MAG: hypothetical protein C0478_15570 [Planctomyces sp.]|jgi:hypothetical protein|nr:hypothetical protein [Planctomyces sp.]
MQIMKALWDDCQGAVLSAELVLLGTVGVLGSIVGLNAVASAVNGEMVELAQGFRSLDQSYVIRGHQSCGAWTAGSYYRQAHVEESVAAICAQGELDRDVVEEQIRGQRGDYTPPEQQGDFGTGEAMPENDIRTTPNDA